MVKMSTQELIHNTQKTHTKVATAT